MAAILNLETNLSEFIYTVAREAPISAKRRLPEKYFNAILTDKKAMRFAAKSTDKERREFLAHLGIEQFVILADVNKLVHKDIREVLKNIDEKDKPSATLKKLSDNNVFISSNREFCYSLLNVSGFFNTPVYIQNLDLIRSTYNERNWSNKLTTQVHSENIEEKEAMERFVKFVYGVLWADDSCEQTTEVDSPTARILLYLYLKKGYLSHEKLSLGVGFTMRQIYMSVKKCLELMLVQRHPKDSVKEYQITAKGILAINKYIERIMKSFDF